MRTCILFTAILLMCAIAHAQNEDSTQVLIPTPPQVSDENVSPPPPDGTQIVVDTKWFQQHNQRLLDIFNILVDNMYEGQQARLLKERFSREKESPMRTADDRMGGIKKLIKLRLTNQ